MGSYCNESYAEFLDSLKAAGVVIRNESEVRERLAESQRWRSAFMTLAANGRMLGIEFSVAGKSSDPGARPGVCGKPLVGVQARLVDAGRRSRKRGELRRHDRGRVDELGHPPTLAGGVSLPGVPGVAS